MQCFIRSLAVTIKIQYLCVLKYIELEQRKKSKISPKSQKGTNIQYKSILFKTGTNKTQQNIVINAFESSGRCRVF